jgi:hypothetical protein
MENVVYAYCYPNGVIKFGKKVPDGALEIAHGKGREFKKRIFYSGALKDDGKTSCIENVAIFDNQEDKLLAFLAYREWINGEIGTKNQRLVREKLLELMNSVCNH